LRVRAASEVVPASSTSTDGGSNGERFGLVDFEAVVGAVADKPVAEGGRTARPPAGGDFGPQPGAAAFDNLLAFVLGDRRQDVVLQPSGWAAGVERLVDGDELDAQVVELGERVGEVTEAATEPVESVYDQEVNLSGATRTDEGVECRAGAEAAAHPFVGELVDDVAAESLGIVAGHRRGRSGVARRATCPRPLHGWRLGHR
jgi:hypothetical protein